MFIDHLGNCGTPGPASGAHDHNEVVTLRVQLSQWFKCFFQLFLIERQFHQVGVSTFVLPLRLVEVYGESSEINEYGLSVFHRAIGSLRLIQLLAFEVLMEVVLDVERYVL